MAQQKSDKALVIDCQILQTAAFDRGMGKYTLSLLSEFQKTNKFYEQIEIILNSNLNKDKKRLDIVKSFTGINKITFLDLPTDISVDHIRKQKQARESISLYIEEIRKKYENVDFLITSPFFVDFSTAFPDQTGIRKFVISYDVIPYKIWHLLRIFPDDIYFNHFNLYFQADRIFTISHAVRDDLVNLLGINADKITPIDGGPFKKISTKDMDKIVLKKPFIIYPSAPIVHKNNKRAAHAFSIFNKSHDNKYTLYLTSSFDENTQNELKKISKNLEFTGNISDGALAYAYSQAEALFFPSLSEGLGMPVLEAMQYDVPVACSDIPVLSELSEDAFYKCNPVDKVSMVKALEGAVLKVDWPRHKKAMIETRAKYTWKRSAGLLAKGLEKTGFNGKKTGSLQLQLPRPNADSPSAVLGELCYAALYDKYKTVGLKFTITHQRANRPSYVAQLHESEINGPVITFKDNSKFRGISRKRRITISVHTANRDTKKTTLFASRVVVDKAVQLKSWQFRTAEGEPITAKYILNFINT